MLVTEFFQLLTRVFYVLLAALTLIDYLRHRERMRFDIALVFLALSSSIIIVLVLDLFGLTLADVPFLSKIGQIGLISQPYLLLRLVAYFRPLPGNIRWAAIIGWAISCLVVLFVGTPLPPVVTFPIIIYFIVVNGYAASAFIRGAFSSAGVARHRLRFAGVASVLLLTLFVIVGIRLVFPLLWPDISAAVQLLSILTVITYYLGFAPPRWLRQGWQFGELRNYLLKDISKLNNQTASTVMMRLREAVMHGVGANQVIVALWDQDQRKLVLENNADSLPQLDFNINEGIFKEAWHRTEPTVVHNVATADENSLRLMKALKSEMLFIVPIAANEGTLGVMLVFMEYGSLFVDDDLSLLAIFAQQTAILLENFRVLEQQRSYSQVLERTVQARTDALKRSNDELRQFAYVASHDLQEPLRMVISYLQLIEERYVSQLDSTAHEFFAFAIDGAKRMKNLIEALLAYSRIDTQLQNFKPVDLQKVFEDVRNILKVAIIESGATVTNDALPQLTANEAMIVQLLQNLVSNGMKYQKTRKPEVHIGVEETNDEWLFSVKDNGIGIEPQNLERIFVIFQRLHAQNEYPGTGIGLAICKKVVEHHGGRIWAESTVGEGTTFYFTIPKLISSGSQTPQGYSVTVTS